MQMKNYFIPSVTGLVWCEEEDLLLSELSLTHGANYCNTPSLTLSLILIQFSCITRMTINVTVNSKYVIYISGVQ